jgi:hypothetical protein
VDLALKDAHLVTDPAQPGVQEGEGHGR